MPRNGKEGLLFSFAMSALMIYIMAALNYGVRTGDVGGTAWSYAVFNFPLAFVVGIVCDLAICTPLSRWTMRATCRATDRPVWKGLVVKFCMVVLMTVAMTIFGVLEAVGPSRAAVTLFFVTFPYNFIIALPLQMLVIAPICARFVHAVGDRARWNQPRPVQDQTLAAVDVKSLIVRDAYTVRDDATVADAVRLMVDKQVSGVPVTRADQTVCGFISESDVLRFFARSDVPVSDISTLITGMAVGEYPTERFADLMRERVTVAATPEVVTFEENGDLTELCGMFGLGQYKKVPVVSEGRLTGVINRSAVTRSALQAYARSHPTPVAA